MSQGGEWKASSLSGEEASMRRLGQYMLRRAGAGTHCCALQGTKWPRASGCRMLMVLDVEIWWARKGVVRTAELARQP